MESFLRQFLAVDNQDPIERVPVELSEVVHEVVELLNPVFRHADVALKVNVASQAELVA